MSKGKYFLFGMCFAMLFQACSGPEEKIKNRTWEGQVYRTTDDKELSEVRLKMTSDTLLIFSNAIFGAGNDTLTVVKYDEKDTTYVYRNTAGETVRIKCDYVANEKSEKLFFIGNDFYVVMRPSDMDISAPGALKFYRNIIVPRDAYLYLDGTYEGVIEFEDQMMEMAALFSSGPIKLKFIFQEDFKVRTFGRSFWGGGSEVQPYSVEGDRIYIGDPNAKKKNQMQTEGFKVVDNGSKLVLQTDKANIVMSRVY